MELIYNRRSQRITEIASELNPERSEPRRSVEMMDDICAIALTQDTSS